MHYLNLILDAYAYNCVYDDCILLSVNDYKTNFHSKHSSIYIHSWFLHSLQFFFNYCTLVRDVMWCEYGIWHPIHKSETTVWKSCVVCMLHAYSNVNKNSSPPKIIIMNKRKKKRKEKKQTVHPNTDLTKSFTHNRIDLLTENRMERKKKWAHCSVGYYIIYYIFYYQLRYGE